MAKFKHEGGDWTRYRQLPNLVEVDFHPPDDHFVETPDRLPYWEEMEQVRSATMEALKKAQGAGIDYVLFTHGWSTSRRGKPTSRSVVRGLMRSPEATPFIIRAECVQHRSAFVARIRKRDTNAAGQSLDAG